MVVLVPIGDAGGRGDDAARPARSTAASRTAAPVTDLDAGSITELVTEGVDDLVRSVVEAAASGESDPRWGTFLGVDPDTHQVVGTCGYRGAPHGGRVEIAFWTFPPYEGRGWATAMARALVERALKDPDVGTVLAHTLPERAPATSVLTAAGLRPVDSVRRDEPGRSGSSAVRGQVWRWERRGR